MFIREVTAASFRADDFCIGTGDYSSFDTWFSLSTIKTIGCNDSNLTIANAGSNFGTKEGNAGKCAVHLNSGGYIVRTFTTEAYIYSETQTSGTTSTTDVLNCRLCYTATSTTPTINICYNTTGSARYITFDNTQIIDYSKSDKRTIFLTKFNLSFTGYTMHNTDGFEYNEVSYDGINYLKSFKVNDDLGVKKIEDVRFILTNDSFITCNSSQTLVIGDILLDGDNFTLTIGGTSHVKILDTSKYKQVKIDDHIKISRL